MSPPTCLQPQQAFSFLTENRHHLDYPFLAIDFIAYEISLDNMFALYHGGQSQCCWEVDFYSAPTLDASAVPSFCTVSTLPKTDADSLEISVISEHFPSLLFYLYFFLIKRINSRLTCTSHFLSSNSFPRYAWIWFNASILLKSEAISFFSQLVPCYGSSPFLCNSTSTPKVLQSSL